MTDLTFEYIDDPAIVIARAGAHTTTERLAMTSVALAKLAHAYDYGHHADAAQARERWIVLTCGAVASLEDPAEHYRREGVAPARAAILGARVKRAMTRSTLGVRDDALGHAVAIATTQGVPAKEFDTLVTLAMLATDAAERLAGAVRAHTMVAQCLTSEIAGEEGAPRRWAGLLATRLDRPDLLELETRHVMLTALGALIDAREGIGEWIPRERDPSVRIREPRDHPGLPLVLAPFVMETEAAWQAVAVGEALDEAFAEAAPAVEALRAALAEGPANAS